MEILAIRILICVAVALAFLGGGYWKGRSDANRGWEQKALAMEVASQKRLAQVANEVRAIELEATERLSALSTKHTQEMKDAKAKSDRVLADVRAGTYRLSIPTTSRCRDAETLYPASTGRPRAEERAELATEAAAALVSIAADGDEAIRQLNACIDAYNEVRAKFNAKPE